MPTAKKVTKPKTASRATAARPKPKSVKRASPARSSSLKKNSRFSKNQLIAFVVIFAAIGGFFLYRSLAAPPAVASLQGEAMPTQSIGGVGAANLAVSGASGGSVKRFSANTSIAGNVTLSRAATSMSVIARGTTCKPWWPWVSVSVDGVTRIAAQKVGQTGFKSYTANVNIAAGKHNVLVSASNDGVTATGCQRHLDVDVVTFFGAGGTTTNPTPPIPPTPPVVQPTPPTPPVVQPTPPTPPVTGTVGVPYTCNGPVNGVHVVGTGSDGIALVNLKSGCTGNLTFDIHITSGGGDGVKVQGGAHDLSIGPSTILCDPSPAQFHEDGVQVQGGTNVTFHGLKVVCPSINGQGAGAFYINGKDFGPITNVICDGCNLEHTHGGVTYNQGTGHPHPVNSGARNSILHAPHPFLDYTGGATGFLNQNNTSAAACTTMANC